LCSTIGYITFAHNKLTTGIIKFIIKAKRFINRLSLTRNPK